MELIESSPAPLEHSVRDSRGRFRGVDSIRAVCAAVVVLGHIGIFSSAHSHPPHIPTALVRFLAVAFNGPAAVIVFFVISGFCIHLPYRGTRPIRFASYISRRLLRVGLPALLAVGYTVYVLHAFWVLNAVLWSILCEIIYYLIYPLLRKMAMVIKWSWMICGTYVVGVVLAVTHLSTLRYAENAYIAFGVRWTWLLGLPCWLMGCWLAEKVEAFPVLSKFQIWSLRGLVVVVSIALRILKFHTTTPFASNCLTLNLFAFLACVWLGCEIQYFEHAEAPTWLEWAGTWSYSLYLVHPLIPGSLVLLHLAWLDALITREHFILLCITFPIAYAYHLAIEKPSHITAVRVSRAL